MPPIVVHVVLTSFLVPVEWLQRLLHDESTNLCALAHAGYAPFAKVNAGEDTRICCFCRRLRERVEAARDQLGRQRRHGSWQGSWGRVERTRERHFVGTEELIQLQPDYADAWAGLADVYAVYEAEPSPAIVPWPGNSVDAGVHAAREALRLAPDFGEAHASLGKLYVAQRRWAEAERAFARAVALSPHSTARQWYGTMFLRLRWCDEALEQVEVAVRLDPLTALVNEALESVYLGCGEPGRALAVFDAVLAMHPTAHTTRHRRSVALMRLARDDEAIRELRRWPSRCAVIRASWISLGV